VRIHPLDLAVLVVYLVGVAAWGAWLGRGQKGGRDYFLGGRELPWGAVMLSVIATETSTLTFLSIPGVAYLGTFVFLQLALGYIVGRAIVAWVLLPAYYRGELVTAYQLLEARFGRPTRRFTSAIFMVTRLLADGVRLFATALPLALLTGLPMPVSILVIGVATAIYTYVGGIRAVVWVDAMQTILYLAGAVAAFVALGLLVPGGWGGIMASASDAGKLVVIDPALDFSLPYTLWAGVLGGAFLSMASHGTDQIIVQRVLTCRDLAGSRKAMVASGFGVLLQFATFLTIGVGLWAYYQGRVFERSDEVFARFIIDALPPGVTGLLVAGIFAAAMSTLSSSINSLASATTYDFWAPAMGVGSGAASPAGAGAASPGDAGAASSAGRGAASTNAAGATDAEDARMLRVGRAFSSLWTVLLIGAAIVFIPLSRAAAAVEVALGIASLVYGGLLGGFALAVLSKRARQPHAIGGIACGVAATTAVWLFARAEVAWPWYVPIGTLVTLGVGWTLARLSGPPAR
jgi:SSS family solute:Na+ symporter